MSRDELVAKARSLGVERPELLTRVELGDEIVRRTQTDPVAQQRARGWFGVARDLVASVVGSGLSLPDAAALIRGDRGVLEFKGPSPVATVTLAEIYATQGHTDRALAMLDEVLTREPEHAPALALRARLRGEPPQAVAATPPEPQLELPMSEPPLSEPAPATHVSEVLPQFEPAPVEAPRPAPEPEPYVAPEPEPAPAHVAPEPEPVHVAPEPEPAPSIAQVEPEPAPLAEEAPVALAFAERDLEPDLVPPEPELDVDADADAVGFNPVPLAPLLSEPPTRPEEPPLEPQPSLATDPEAPVEEQPASDEVVPTLLPPPSSMELEPVLLVVRRTQGDPVVCWDVPAVEDGSGDAFELECHAFRAGERGSERQALTLAVAARRGMQKLAGFASATLIRVALGYRVQGVFAPMLIASEVSVNAGGVVDVRFRPPLTPEQAPTSLERELVAEFATL